MIKELKDLIIKDELDGIYDLVRKGSFNEMITMNESLYRLVEAGAITKEAALNASDDKMELEQFFRGVYRGTKTHGDSAYD